MSHGEIKTGGSHPAPLASHPFLKRNIVRTPDPVTSSAPEIADDPAAGEEKGLVSIGKVLASGGIGLAFVTSLCIAAVVWWLTR